MPALLAAPARRPTGAAWPCRCGARPAPACCYAGLPGDTDPAVAARLVERPAGGGAPTPAGTRSCSPPRRRYGKLVDMWGPVGGLDLMRRVKDQFDPEHRFAPGRFVGGI